jgi:hypothetical protein
VFGSPCPTPARAAACRDVEAATLARDGSPPITRTTLPTCRAHYPGGSSGCACRLLPRSCSLPQMPGGSASALSLSRPAQASLTLRPARSLSRPWRALSRGSGPAGYPAEPLVSYRINRQLSGWNLPPLMIRAFGAHGHCGHGWTCSLPRPVAIDPTRKSGMHRNNQDNEGLQPVFGAQAGLECWQGRSTAGPFHYAT